jgi:hypothetical protein
MLMPCLHDREAAVATENKAEDIARAEHATADTDIIDDSEPPF